MDSGIAMRVNEPNRSKALSKFKDIVTWIPGCTFLLSFSTEQKINNDKKA